MTAMTRASCPTLPSPAESSRGGLARLSYALHDGGDLLMAGARADDMCSASSRATTRENLTRSSPRRRSGASTYCLAGMLANANFGEDQNILRRAPFSPARGAARPAAYPLLSRRRGRREGHDARRRIASEPGGRGADRRRASRRCVEKSLVASDPSAREPRPALKSRVAGRSEFARNPRSRRKKTPVARGIFVTAVPFWL